MSAHIGDVGTAFELTIKDQTGAIVDISTATTKDIILRPPVGANKIKLGAFLTDGTDGKIQYSSLAADLDVEGLWEIQAHIIMSSGEWYSDYETFRVDENL